MDDGASSPIPISTGFPFGGSVQTEAYVSWKEEEGRVGEVC